MTAQLEAVFDDVGVDAAKTGMLFSRELIERPGYEPAGFAAHYARVRPWPPHELLDPLPRCASVQMPNLVAHPGRCTGVLTHAWSGRHQLVRGYRFPPRGYHSFVTFAVAHSVESYRALSGAADRE